MKANNQIGFRIKPAEVYNEELKLIMQKYYENLSTCELKIKEKFINSSDVKETWKCMRKLQIAIFLFICLKTY